MAAISKANRRQTSRSAPNAFEANQCLFAVAAKKDRAAFRQLYEHFAPRVKAMMLKSGASIAEADDMVQTTMMSVWNKAHLFAPDRGQASTWIFTIARNARIDRLRRGASRPYTDVYEVEISDDSEQPDDATHRRKSAVRVREALSQLPGEQRDILTLAFIEDLAHGEISKKLDLPLGTVKSRIRLAYQKLQHLLEDLQ